MSLLTGQVRPLRKIVEGVLCEGCDNKPHCTETATHGMVGEVDSFGVEWIHLCKECVDSVKSEIDNYEQNCAHCKVFAVCVPYKDPEEGYAASQTWVCRPCRTKAIDAFNADFGDAADSGYDDLLI